MYLCVSRGSRNEPQLFSKQRSSAGLRNEDELCFCGVATEFLHIIKYTEGKQRGSTEIMVNGGFSAAANISALLLVFSM